VKINEKLTHFVLPLLKATTIMHEHKQSHTTYKFREMLTSASEGTG